MGPSLLLPSPLEVPNENSSWPRGTALAFSISTFSFAASTAPLGILTRAYASRLNDSAAAPGLSVYEDEILSTAPDGKLALRTGSSVVALYGDSVASLHRIEAGAHVDLERGAIFCNASQNYPIEVHASGGTFTRQNAQPIQAEFRILNSKTLQVTTLRGDLAFSYRDQFQVIPEGETYRLDLDRPPSPQTPAGAGSGSGSNSGSSSGTGASMATGIATKVAFFIVSGAAAGVAAWGIHELVQSNNGPESPAKP